ncbi:unnamed protein product [marine sediment metagenome]|uniref:Response regulatory domain-containing protein n=1 Tax=marine sediment metagenome TaxID=412755 RepID=X1J9C3_9ZZZZ
MTKILIADDKPEVVELVRAILEDELYQVLAASSGEVALKRIREEKPDLVLLDLEMPTMSGFEVLKKLKENSLTEQIPVIMLTAGGRPADKDEARRRGAHDYVTKPFSPSDLLMKIHKILTSAQGG